MKEIFLRVKQIRSGFLWCGVAALTILGLIFILLANIKQITLVVDGQSTQVRTLARTVEGVLPRADIAIQETDRIVPGLESKLVSGMRIQIARSYPIRIEAGKTVEILETPERKLCDILAQAGILLYPGDQVWVDGIRILDPTLELTPSLHRIRVKSSVSITVGDHGRTYAFRSAAPTVLAALWEAGIVIREADQLNVSQDESLSPKLPLTVRRSVPVSIAVDGEVIQTLAAGETVAEALSMAGIPLVGLDTTIPDLHAPIPEDGYIRVIRVREEVLVEQEPIPFETTYQNAPDLEIDNFEIIDPGAYGVLARRTRIRYEDGDEVERITEGKWTVREPQPRVVGYGTKIVIRPLEGSGGLKYWRAVRMYATSYSPCRLGVDYCDDYTASGATLRKGIAAVTVRWYRYMVGTRVFVPGYGVATIADTGGGIPGRMWIDLGYRDEDYVSWHDWITVYFLTPVPPADQIMWILE